jgi:hypothetical protein
MRKRKNAESQERTEATGTLRGLRAGWSREKAMMAAGIRKASDPKTHIRTAPRAWSAVGSI